MNSLPDTITYNPGADVAFILDQTLLPGEIQYRPIQSSGDMVEALKKLRVRGAPLIGAAGAVGLAVAVRNGEQPGVAAEKIASARPTAANLRTVVGAALFQIQDGDPRGLYHWAGRYIQYDREVNKILAQRAQAIIDAREFTCFMTICNAGHLATCGGGTALGVIYEYVKNGGKAHVYVPETRPLRQGARLTAWELSRRGINCTVIPDGAISTYMDYVHYVIVGADRIMACNGTVYNKIGTNTLAIVAEEFQVPFFVAATRDTIDTSPDDRTVIEMRNYDEILSVDEAKGMGTSFHVENPAFDRTPGHRVSGYLTDGGYHALHQLKEYM